MLYYTMLYYITSYYIILYYIILYYIILYCNLLQSNSQIWPKSTPKWLQSWLQNIHRLSPEYRIIINVLLHIIMLHHNIIYHIMSYYIGNSFQYSSKICPKWTPKWTSKWLQNGPQEGPKWVPESGHKLDPPMGPKSSVFHWFYRKNDKSESKDGKR